VFGTFVLNIDLQLDGPATSATRNLDGLNEQGSADPARTPFGDDEQFIEPGDAAPVFQGPCVRQGGQSNGVNVMRDEDCSTIGVRKKASNGPAEIFAPEVNPVLIELGSKQRDDGIEVGRRGGVDSHGPKVRGSPPAGFAGGRH
jgi:hypothetical protein